MRRGYLRPYQQVARVDYEDDTPAGESLAQELLSEREREVLVHTATGLSNKELADRLGISEGTVKAHLTSIFQKLGVRGRTELAAAYHGIIPHPIDAAPGRPLRDPA